MRVRRTRAIGRPGGDRVARQPGGDGGGLVVAGDEDDPGSRRVDRPRRQRHPHPSVELTAEVDELVAVDHRVARRPRGGVPVGPHPQVDDVEAVGQGRRVAGGGAAEVAGRHRHQVVPAGQAGELVGVAVGMAVGRHPLVDLPDVDRLPRHDAPVEPGEHRRRARSPRHRERRPTPPPHRPPQPPRDRARHPPRRPSPRPDTSIHPSVSRHPSVSCGPRRAHETLGCRLAHPSAYCRRCRHPLDPTPTRRIADVRSHACRPCAWLGRVTTA